MDLDGILNFRASKLGPGSILLDWMIPSGSNFETPKFLGESQPQLTYVFLCFLIVNAIHRLFGNLHAIRRIILRRLVVSRGRTDDYGSISRKIIRA